jgi:Cu2+-exporting ATPase
MKNDLPPMTKQKLAIEGMRCASCSQIIEFRLQRLPGVADFHINAASHNAEVAWDPARISLQDIVDSVTDLGYRALPLGARDKSADKESKLNLWRLFIAGFAMMQVMMYAFPAYLVPVPTPDGDLTPDIDRLLKLASMVIAVPGVFFSASPFYRSAWRALRNRQVGMDLPISIGVLVTFGASVWATFAGGAAYFDSVIMFVLLLLGARMIEQRVQRKSTAALRALTELVPLTVQRLADYPASHRVEEVPAAQLRAGDVLLVAPGTQIPADGKVLEGESDCDEALMTGESQPVKKSAGAALIGGAMNLSGALVMRADQVGDATRLATLVQMMEKAAGEKPPPLQLADRHAGRFMTAILALSVIAGLAWWHIDPARALWVAVSVMVITCPCALSLATPGVMAGAIGVLAKRGVLIARGRAIETLTRATHVVFDKTGTLTQGRLQLVETVSLREGMDETLCLSKAVRIAGSSMHPVAKALTQAAAEQGMFAVAAAEAAMEAAGQGMEVRSGERRYRLGSIAFVEALHGCGLLVPKSFSGKTLAAFGDDRGWIALFALQDTLRADAQECIAFLKRQGKHVLLFSGDRNDVAADVAAELRIDTAIGDLRPEQKHDLVKGLQARGAVVAMVGDGMNDGPVLSLADVSIAMGHGAPISQARSDVVLMSNRLQDLQAAVEISHKSLTLIRENLAWALLYNLVAVPAAATGLLLPWHAAIGMSLSSLIVVLNSLRILKR